MQHKDRQAVWQTLLLPAGDHAHGVTKILKRDPTSEATSPHEEAHLQTARPSDPPQPTPSAPPMHAATAGEFSQSFVRGQAQTVNSQGPSQGQARPAVHAQPGATPTVARPSVQQSQQTPAGLAAAAAAQAALAAPPPAPRQVPKYNPPATAHLTQAHQHQSLSQPQHTPAVRPNQPPPYQPQQAQAYQQTQPRPDANPNSNPNPLHMAGMRPQGPQPSDPRLRTQQPPPGTASSHSTPSQQITAQARASHTQQGQGQAPTTGVSGPLPSSFLQFGSMQPIPSSGSSVSAGNSNPLTFGIPAAMVPGSGNVNGPTRQNAPSQPAQGDLMLHC